MRVRKKSIKNVVNLLSIKKTIKTIWSLDKVIIILLINIIIFFNKKGDKGDNFYILLEGSVGIWVKKSK